MKCYDLDNLDVVIVKDWQDLIDVLNQILTCCQAIDGNTDELEAKLDSIITLLTSLDGKDFATETTLNALLTAFNAEDFATETTLAAIKAQTDQLTFTGGDLNVNATVNLNTKGANANNYSYPFLPTATEAQLLAANNDRKEVIISNNTNKTIWLKYDAIAAIGEGIPLRKNDILIDTIFTGEIRYYYDAGTIGSLTITEAIT